MVQIVGSFDGKILYFAVSLCCQGSRVSDESARASTDFLVGYEERTRAWQEMCQIYVTFYVETVAIVEIVTNFI